MIKLEVQQQLDLSPYSELFELLIEKDNFWREINENINFGFVVEELKDRYSSTMGRPAEDIIRMFKFLLLKGYYKISDRELVRRAKKDMEFKYFLGYAPEETKIIDDSSLTKFRKERIKTGETADDLMELLLRKTVEYAIKEGVIEAKNKIVIDSTHTVSKYGKLSPREELQRQAKNLRKSIYQIDKTKKEQMPSKKKETTGMLEDEIEYIEELIGICKEIEFVDKIPAIREQLDMLEETKEDIVDVLKNEKELKRTEYSKDEDAKTGHKTADTSFFGYKTHIAMTPERIMTAAVVTSGEATDGKQFEQLVEKSEKTGIEIEAVVGDGAYSSSEILKYCQEKEIEIASKLNKMILEGHCAQKDFEYNKDAEMYVCKAGHMAIRKSKDKTGSKNRDVIRYYFDVDKCKVCPFREGCYKAGAKKKSLTVTLQKNEHLLQKEFMETDRFQELYKERYKIEAKNAEIKNNGDMKFAYGCGQVTMTIQGASTLFLTNIKRIRTLKKEKEQKKEGV